MKNELAIEMFVYIEVDGDSDADCQTRRVQDVLYQAGFESKINERFIKPKEDGRNG